MASKSEKLILSAAEQKELARAKRDELFIGLAREFFFSLSLGSFCHLRHDRAHGAGAHSLGHHFGRAHGILRLLRFVLPH